MEASAEALERQLVTDLASLEQRFADEEFSTELYRALANNVWAKSDGPPGEVSLSWRRAEELVNELRAGHGQQPLTLAQTGGEGEVTALIADELGRLGWTASPLDTSSHHEEHLTEPESAPPPEHGQHQAPGDPSGEWERVAHEEAERERQATPARTVDRGPRDGA